MSASFALSESMNSLGLTAPAGRLPDTYERSYPVIDGQDPAIESAVWNAGPHGHGLAVGRYMDPLDHSNAGTYCRIYDAIDRLGTAGLGPTLEGAGIRTYRLTDREWNVVAVTHPATAEFCERANGLHLPLGFEPFTDGFGDLFTNMEMAGAAARRRMLVSLSPQLSRHDILVHAVAGLAVTEEVVDRQRRRASDLYDALASDDWAGAMENVMHAAEFGQIIDGPGGSHCGIDRWSMALGIADPDETMRLISGIPLYIRSLGQIAQTRHIGA